MIKMLKYFFGLSPCFLLFSLLCCQNKTATTIDLSTQVSGVYQVHHLQVFDEMIDTSRDFVGLVTLTQTDAFHVKLSMDIRYLKDDAIPVETLCTLQPIHSKVQLVETKTNEVLGYVENREIHLHSSDAKGAQTTIIGLLQNE